ncbi:MAG: hypothetical protein ACM3W7_04310, partial [Acidobacteriota bacterium]
MSVLFHLLVLYQASTIPHIFVDETHYAVTSQNVRAGHGYSLRDAFSHTVPPLQPLFIAAVQTLSHDSQTLFFVASVLVMCASLFPAYYLALEIGLGWRMASAFGLCASLNPHTFYAATYMSETMQYPLFLVAFLIMAKWIKAPGIRLSLLLGGTLGTMALVRYATGTTWIAFVIGCVAWAAVGIGESRWRERLGHTLLVSGIYGAFQGVWWLFKISHGSSALGMYAHAWHQLPHLTMRLVATYIADCLLAAGVLTPIAIVAGIVRLRRERPSLLFAALPVILLLVLSTAIYDGGLTGELRERYAMYVFPLILLFAISGAGVYSGQCRFWTVAGTILATAACAGVVAFYCKSGDPLLGAPWAHLARVISLHGPTHNFSMLAFACIPLAFTTAGLAAIASRRVSAETGVLAVALVVNALALAEMGSVFGERAKEGRRRLEPALQITRDVPAGSRLAITGLPAGFGLTSFTEADRLGSFSRATLLNDDTILRLE